MGLADYKEVVGTSAAISTVGQMFAGLFICKDIYKQKSCKNVDPMPFIGGMAMSILTLQYALILKDYTMINVNVCGIILNFMYMACYYIYSTDRANILTTLIKASIFVAFFVAYAQLEDESKIEFRFGLIVTALMFILIASPLCHLGEIFETKSTEMLPFPIIFMGAIVTFQWLLYGYIIDNAFIINAVAFTISVAELSLFVIFPSTPTKVTSQKDQQKKRN